MLDRAGLETLFDYHYWARDRILSAVAALQPDQFGRDLGNSFASIQATLAHLINAEAVWLTRMSGETVPACRPEDVSDLTATRARWSHTEDLMRRFLAGLAPADLQRLVLVRSPAGQELTNPVWQVLQQLTYHGSYHRGQIVTLLRQLGAAPVQTDLILYYRQQSGQL